MTLAVIEQINEVEDVDRSPVILFALRRILPDLYHEWLEKSETADYGICKSLPKQLADFESSASAAVVVWVRSTRRGRNPSKGASP